MSDPQSSTTTTTTTNPALEPFLLMARSNKGAAAAKIARDVTGAAGVYGFGELLDTQNIKDTNPDHTQSYNLLQLFAYGTISDYAQNPSAFPTLNANQLNKLRQLSLVTLCLKERSLPYSTLLPALYPSLPSLPTDPATSSANPIRALEDLIIDSTYAGLLAGKMDQKREVLGVDWCVGRDVRVGDQGEGEGNEGGNLREVREKLSNWCENTQNLLNSLSAQIHSSLLTSHSQSLTKASQTSTLHAAYTARWHDLKSGKARSSAIDLDGDGDGSGGDEDVVALGLGGGPGEMDLDLDLGAEGDEGFGDRHGPMRGESGGGKYGDDTPWMGSNNNRRGGGGGAGRGRSGSGSGSGMGEARVGGSSGGGFTGMGMGSPSGGQRGRK